MYDRKKIWRRCPLSMTGGDGLLNTYMPLRAWFSGQFFKKGISGQ